MNKKIILGAIALLFANMLYATTPGTRDYFYKSVEGPRHSAKEHVCVFDDKLYTEKNGVVSVRDISNLSAAKPLLTCTSGAVRRIHAFNPDIMCVETTAPNVVHGGIICGFEIFSISTGSQIFVKQNGSVQGFCDGRVYFREYSQGTSAGQVLHLESRSVTPTSLPEGKLVFNSEGDLQYVINRSHCGQQTVHVYNEKTDAHELMYTSEKKNVLVDVDGSGNVFEARYDVRSDKWLPWLIPSTRFQSGASEQCIYPSCAGSVIHFKSTPEFDFFTIRMTDRSIKYELIEKQAAPLGALLHNVLPSLIGKQVISGPEFEQLHTLSAFHLVTVDSGGLLKLLRITRDVRTGLFGFVSKLAPKLVTSELVTVSEVGAFEL